MRLAKAFFVVCLIFIYTSSTCWAASINLSSSSVNIDQNSEIQVDTALSISVQDGTKYYLRGVFFKSGTSNYCGLTWNGSSFFSGPYSTNQGWKNFFPVTILNSSWSGTLQVKLDPADSGCQDNGDYLFKVERFTDSGSASFDSQNTVTFTAVLPTPTPTVTPTLTRTPTPTPIKTPTPTKVPTATPVKITPTKVPTPTPTIIRQPTNKIATPTPLKLVMETSIPSTQSEMLVLSQDNTSSSSENMSGPQVLGEVAQKPQDQEAQTVSKKSNKGFGWLFYLCIAFGIMSIACGILLFRKWRKQKEDAI